MKRFVIAMLIATGCGSKREPAAESGSAAERPAVTDPIGFCQRARMMMIGRRKCFPEDTSLKMGLEGLEDTERDAPTEPEPRRRVAVSCAIMLEGMMRAEQPKACPLDVTDDERAELARFLDAWYGERTAPPVTGDAAVDEVLVKLAGQRDAACACKDLTCAHQAGAELASLASDAPAIAREAAAKMVDEVARCRQKLATSPPPR